MVEIGVGELFIERGPSWAVVHRLMLGWELVRNQWRHVPICAASKSNLDRCLAFRSPPIMRVQISPSACGWDAPKKKIIFWSSLVQDSRGMLRRPCKKEDEGDFSRIISVSW